MKRIILVVLLLVLAACGWQFGLLADDRPIFAGEIYNIEPLSIDGTPVPMSQYKGKVVMVVNTASRCGFTPQYEGLEAVYQKYKERGFVLLGFPSNDFAGQEPGSNAEIKKFCTGNYNITFPLFAKGSVTGDHKQELFKFLTEGKEQRGEIRWNFEKFLIDRKGTLRERYRSISGPQSSSIAEKIEKLLGESP